MSFSLLYLSIGVYGWVPDLHSLLAKLQHSLLCTMDMYREEEEQKIEREKLRFKEERLLKRQAIRQFLIIVNHFQKKNVGTVST